MSRGGSFGQSSSRFENPSHHHHSQYESDSRNLPHPIPPPIQSRYPNPIQSNRPPTFQLPRSGYLGTFSTDQQRGMDSRSRSPIPSPTSSFQGYHERERPSNWQQLPPPPSNSSYYGSTSGRPIPPQLNGRSYSGSGQGLHLHPLGGSGVTSQSQRDRSVSNPYYHRSHASQLPPSHMLPLPQVGNRDPSFLEDRTLPPLKLPQNPPR